MKPYIANNEALELVKELKRIKDFKKDLEKNEERLKDKLSFLMLEKEQMVTEDGEEVLTWKTSADIKFFDVKRFELEQPDIYEAYVSYKPGVKRLIIK